MGKEDWIQRAIKAFTNKDFKLGNDILVEFAKDWASVGNTKESFIDMQNHIIQSAKLNIEKRDDPTIT